MGTDPSPWPSDRRVLRDVRSHYRRFFAGHKVDKVEPAPGPTGQRIPILDILRFHPGPRSSLWTYATVGACAVRSSDHRTEFVLLAPEPNETHCETLTMTTYYHAGSRDQRLGVGHTVPIGSPWLPDSQCDHLLVSLPYPFGPALERCKLRDGHLQVLWLVPITADERDFKIEHGLERIEAHFDDVGLNYWDPGRRNSV